jgi:hypothetical protein
VFIANKNNECNAGYGWPNKKDYRLSDYWVLLVELDVIFSRDENGF